MICFETIRYKNFLSTGNVYTTISLNKNPTTLIVGENGAGKSTILDALTFALYNKSFRKIKKSQLINTITNKNTVVEIEFSIYSNKYKIVRGIKPNIFEIYKNNKLLNQSADSKDYQEILEKQILKINYKSFCQVVILGSATFLPFMQLPAAQRREIIENLLDLEIFTSMNSILKDKISNNKELIYKEESQIKILEDRISMIERYSEKLKKDKEKENNERKEKVKKYKSSIKKEQKLLEKLEIEIVSFSSFQQNENKLLQKYNKLNSLKSKIEVNLENTQKEIKFLSEYDDCPTCKQSIDIDFKNKTTNEKNKSIEEFENGLKQLIDNISVIEKNLKEIKKNKSKLDDLKIERNKVLIQIKSFEDNIKSLENEVKNSVEENSLYDIDKTKEELKKSIDEYNRLSNDKNILSSLSIILKDGGIKSKIIKKYIPLINKQINLFLTNLNFYVKFELDEEFNDIIKSRHRDEFSYSSFSEGERMKINLAILFTWRIISKLRNSVNTNLLIMDEVFDSSLDSDSTEDFMKIINNFDTKTNIFIISHKTEQLNDKFDNIIKFKKVKNFSKVV